MSVRNILEKYANWKNAGLATPFETKLPPGLENMCCEIYNPGNEEITLRTYHPDWHRMHFFGLGPDWWKVLKCKPGDWVFLPHGQYIWTVPSGSKEYRVTINVGDRIGVGEKLPSRPDGPKKIRVFT